MKEVKVTYFKSSGKYYTTEVIKIDSNLSGYHALAHELPKHHRIKEMYMLVENNQDENEPYIVPHLYLPKESD